MKSWKDLAKDPVSVGLPEKPKDTWFSRLKEHLKTWFSYFNYDLFLKIRYRILTTFIFFIPLGFIVFIISLSFSYYVSWVRPSL